MKKTLLILRHAKSSWSHAGLSDHDRPLNKRGKRDAPRIGQLLRTEDIVPAQIISSTAKRAKQTAEAVAKSSGYENEIVFERSLYHGYPDDYITYLAKSGIAAACVMVVGHNPGLEMLVEQLSGADEFMATATLAHIELPIEDWSELNEQTQGKLVNLWRPRELPIG